jgi:hypothetical protein
MKTADPAQETFELWRRTLEEGTQAWLRAMSPAAPPSSPQAPPLDFTQFWRPILTQGLEAWQKAVAQGGPTPDFMEQWKAYMDQSIEAWSKALGEAMATEGFAQSLGRHLEQFLAVQAPIKKGFDQYTDAALKTLGFPSRAQVVSLAQQVVGLEERIEGIEDRLDELKALLTEVARAVSDHPAERRPVGTERARRTGPEGP